VKNSTIGALTMRRSEVLNMILLLRNIIKADGGPCHERTVGALFHWFCGFKSTYPDF
jgi:hypothetical protein